MVSTVKPVPLGPNQLAAMCKALRSQLNLQEGFISSAAAMGASMGKLAIPTVTLVRCSTISRLSRRVRVGGLQKFCFLIREILGSNEGGRVLY